MKREICCILAVMLLGCTEIKPSEERHEEEIVREGSELFKEAGENAEGEKVTRLYTQGNKYGGLRGYTLWTVWGEEGVGDVFEEREVRVSKVKGQVQAGYGLVICQGERETGRGKEETMLVVMINNVGEYAIGKVKGGEYESMVWWTKGAWLRSGVGAPNEIRVSKEGEKFVLEANGKEEARFIDEQEPVHKGGRNGYIVVISPYDVTGGGEVDVYFTEKR